MRRTLSLALLGLSLTLSPAYSQAQPPTLGATRDHIAALLRDHLALGSRPFDTKWPNGSPKEKYFKQPDGTWSYSKFFEAGGYAEKYQRSASKAVVYERFFGNGKTQELLRHDDRTDDFTSYWENGEKKVKYQHNSQTKEEFFQAKDKDGKDVTSR